MRACPCGCSRWCRIGLSRTARLYEELERALTRLRPAVTAARRDPSVDGDFRTIACNRSHRGEQVRTWLLAHLHERPTPTTPSQRETTRQAAELLMVIDCLLSVAARRSGAVSPIQCPVGRRRDAVCPEDEP